MRKFKTQREKAQYTGLRGTGTDNDIDSSPERAKNQRGKATNSMLHEEEEIDKDSFAEDDEVESMSFDSPKQAQKKNHQSKNNMLGWNLKPTKKNNAINQNKRGDKGLISTD